MVVSLVKNSLTLCLLGLIRITLRALPVTEGRTAVQLVRKAANHTAGLVKAFNEAPANTMRRVCVRVEIIIWGSGLSFPTTTNIS